jgi:hypothetical protein
MEAVPEYLQIFWRLSTGHVRSAIFVQILDRAACGHRRRTLHSDSCLAAADSCDLETERAMCNQKLGLLAQKRGNVEAALE